MHRWHRSACSLQRGHVGQTHQIKHFEAIVSAGGTLPTQRRTQKIRISGVIGEGYIKQSLGNR